MSAEFVAVLRDMDRTRSFGDALEMVAPAEFTGPS